jgi:sarcosine oxidase subunit alpha
VTPGRLPTGGRIDRARRLDVTFDGDPVPAHPGDTLASALLAAGRLVVGRSVLRGRPRGIGTAGSEEPTGIAGIVAPYSEPLATTTTVEAVDGLRAVGLQGQGRLVDEPDPAGYDSLYQHCEVAVVGAGPAGLAAALAAGATGARVLLLDERSEVGGGLLTDTEMGWAQGIAARLRARPNVSVLTRTVVVGRYDANYLVAVQRFGVAPDPAPGAVRERVHRIRAAEVVLATGALERPVVFAGNDLPGVMAAEAARAYLHRFGVLVGRRVVLFTTHDDAYRVAGDLIAGGAHVLTVDPRTPDGDPTPTPAEHLSSGSVLHGWVVAQASADPDGVVGGVLVRRLADGATARLEADLIAVSGGWNPVTQLYSQAGGALVYDESVGAFVATGHLPGVTLAGAAAGLRTTAEIVDDGERAGASAAEAAVGAAAALGHAFVPAGIPSLDPPDDGLDTYPEPAFPLHLVAPDGVPVRELTEHFVDLQRDVTVADLARATGAGLVSVEHVKRYTTAGTGHDQGRGAGLLASAIVSGLLGRAPGEIGVTTYRPPYLPVAFAALAGRERGDLYDPIRTTGPHAWHVAHGALFENVGQWKRPWYYPQARPDAGLEDLGTAVARECRAAREHVAFMDASTLGKIDVQGPDAGEFLDLIYTNLMSTLKVGAIRYGVMCGVDGMVLDDGTVFRLGEHHFLLTTTTGSAAKILDWLEEWLQTEWPQLRVWCTSVTEQWATMAVVGPHSRALVGALGPQLSVANDDFPFMTWRDTQVCGLPARVARVSFSGELAYEINVAWSDAAALWDAVWAVGEPIGLVPYGTETMHVLRAEKGYPIVGQDTDGTVTPQDLGMSWVVSKRKPDYLGKRSHARAENHRADRKQLVGLLPLDRELVLPEGSQLVDDAVVTDGRLRTRPVPMLGHVTSSYPSVALGRPFALALCAAGRDRVGGTVHVVVDGEPHPVAVVGPVLVDPDGLRRDGVGDLAPVTLGRSGSAGLPRSPLAELADDLFAVAAGRPDAGVGLAEMPLGTQVSVRVRPGTDAAERVTALLGTPLPAATGEVAPAGADTVLCLGPDEYLMLAGPGHGAGLAGQLAGALGVEGAAIDVSAARTTLRVTGPRARRVLAHGTGVDLDRLRPGRCAQTLLAQCAVIIVSDGVPGTADDQLRVLVRSSFAAHLARWLLLTAPVAG